MSVLVLPAQFTFKAKDSLDFKAVLEWFDWDNLDQDVVIDVRTCKLANYQALALLLLYVWHLKSKGHAVSLELSPSSQDSRQSPSDMWRRMGAVGWSQVLYERGNQFKGSTVKPLIAIRSRDDAATALSKAEEFAKGFNVEYEKTLQYVLSELLYNTMEHGQRWFNNNRIQIPSIIQFTWYEKRNEISFIVADLGIGIKKHLEMAYPAVEDDLEALRMAIKPQISGTFGKLNSYSGKNNAGVGLYISTNIVQKLGSEMYLVSGQGLLHVSPRDITGKLLTKGWLGTFVLVTVKLTDKKLPVNLHEMLSQARDAALREIASREGKELADKLVVDVGNYFGKYAENKEGAIEIRDRKLLPSLQEGKDILLDFANVSSAPHSFLSALLATPIKSLGMLAYRRIKVTNATPEIRETIDYIFDENTA